MEQSQVQPCNQKQREIFARLLAEAKNREELGLESTDNLDKRIEEEFLPKLAQDKGASPLIAKVRSLHKELDDSEKALDDLGFSCDEDSIRLRWEAPQDLRKTLKEAGVRLIKNAKGRSGSTTLRFSRLVGGKHRRGQEGRGDASLTVNLPFLPTTPSLLSGSDPP